MKKKLIITADDYGVVPSINQGVTELVKNEKINSVAALANYDGQGLFPSSQENIRELKKLADAKRREDFDLQIGCHLTITSGKAVSEELKNSQLRHILLASDDTFLGYKSLKRLREKELVEDLKNVIKAELQAQIDKAKEAADGDITHLSCHHNSLNTFEEYYDSYLEVAAKNNLPIRSPRILPTGKDNFYNVFLRLSHLKELSPIDRSHMRDFSGRIVDFFRERHLHSTDYMDSSHYGPIPFLPIWFKNWSIKKKKRKLKKALDAYRHSSNDKTLELMVHVAHEDNKEKIPKGMNYPGINERYFDSRRMEYASIAGFNPDGYDLCRWCDL